MNREDIIRMAREVGIDPESDTLCNYDGWVDTLVDFAALVAAAERKSKPHSLGPGEMELSLRRENKGELFELRHRFTAEQISHGNDFMVEETAQAMDEMLDERIAAAIRARGQA